MTDKRTIKTWKSYPEQLEILRNRSLIIEDDKVALGYLKTIGYYRLSGYLYSFRQQDSLNAKSRLDDFVQGSHFLDVKQLYMFDKKLRQLALDALERIEIAIRTHMSYILGKKDPLAHKRAKFFDDKFDHTQWLDKYQKLLDRQSKSSFVIHHFDNYGDLPIWAAAEVWDFGAMSKLYQGMLAKDKDYIAKLYHLKSGKHLQTHLHAFNFIRNVAAHHGRLWNRAIVFQANLKGLQAEQWRQLDTKRVFVYFCLMKRMLDVICPNSTWGERFLSVLDEFPKVENRAVQPKHMGLTINPKEWDLWANSNQRKRKPLTLDSNRLGWQG